MNKISKVLCSLVICYLIGLFLTTNMHDYLAYDSIDSTGVTQWNIANEQIVDKYGLHYSHMTGTPTTNGIKGSEKNVNYFSMKTDGINSKLVTWIKPMSNGSFGTSRLTTLAKDYEEKNPGWIVVAGINAVESESETNHIQMTFREMFNTGTVTDMA